MTSDNWIQIQHKLNSPHESHMCDPLFNFDLHPSGYFFDFFFFFEVRCVVQFIWNWREWLYVAWTVNPCTSLPDSLGNSFWIWMRRKGPWKKETDIWHVWDGNWLQFMFFCYVRKLLTQKLLYTISANIKIRMLNSIIYMKKAHTTNDSQILNPISTIVLSTY